MEVIPPVNSMLAGVTSNGVGVPNSMCISQVFAHPVSIFVEGNHISLADSRMVLAIVQKA